ncbi:hypothetical protein Mal52_27890 [Symmachiella dynata]|uniref:Uncharacterized protein n=1 Tax=Symmachiella dynata TaxID=2527995 RepID=A0A517ZPH1_9PLAN|nr:hypothetical protein [Symmachiella dynata]QDU44310.1 hypothetical protein Mal52_27890 [Symmachiella dynata]
MADLNVSDLADEVARLRSNRDRYRPKYESACTERDRLRSVNAAMSRRIHQEHRRFEIAGVVAVDMATAVGFLWISARIEKPQFVPVGNQGVVAPYGSPADPQETPHHILASVRLAWGGGSATVISKGERASAGISCWHCFSNQRPGYRFKVQFPYGGESDCVLIANDRERDLSAEY